MKNLAKKVIADNFSFFGIGLVGYEMTMLVDRVGEHLSPELRAGGAAAAAWPSN